MRPLVLDATPLIYLTRVGLGSVFEGLGCELVTSPRVRREVVDEGAGRGYPDASVLGELFRRGVIEVREPSDKGLVGRLLEARGLHAADAEVLALALEMGGVAVMDDEAARKTARIFGASFVGTPFILMRAVARGLVARERAMDAFKDMISEGWRCDVVTYDAVMGSLGRL